MSDNATQQEALSGASFQEVARMVDLTVSEVANAALETTVHKGGVAAGISSALARISVAALGDSATPKNVLQSVAPMIHACAGQIIEGRREAQGNPVVKHDLEVEVSAYDVMTKCLGEAPFPTFCIQHAGDLFLFSILKAADGVLHYASIPNRAAVLRNPVEVLMAHCREAATTWHNANPVQENQGNV